jgi:hypothetical protein
MQVLGLTSLLISRQMCSFWADVYVSSEVQCSLGGWSLASGIWLVSYQCLPDDGDQGYGLKAQANADRDRRRTESRNICAGVRSVEAGSDDERQENASKA